jgi:hypothetical protein
MNKKNQLNEEILKIKKYINMLENYETTNAEREDNVVSKVSYPVFEDDSEMNEVIDELEQMHEMYDETGVSIPYGEDSGVITPKFVEESKDGAYHKTMSSALAAAEKYAADKGFTIDPEEMFREFGTGGVSYETTRKGSLTLYDKDGKPQRKRLQIQLYRMPSGDYELNDYVNESLDNLAKQHRIDLTKYDMDQINKGMKVEMEHKNVTSGNKGDTLKIVIAHLDENPRYYDNLDKAEKMDEKHLDTPEEHDMFDQQVKIQNFLNILTSNKPELKQLLQILYENGLYFKLLKLRSGKEFQSKDQIVSDVKSYIEKLDDFDNEEEKSKMLQIINSLSTTPVYEESCGCDEMVNENVKTVSSLIMEALDKNTKYSGIEKLVSLVLYSQIQAQNFHRQTKSFAEHKALNDYYDEITDVLDGFIESYQGKHGIIKKYTGFKPLSYKDNANTIKYFQNLYNKIDSLRKSVKESYLQNQIDEMQELIESVIYKLNYLK